MTDALAALSRIQQQQEGGGGGGGAVGANGGGGEGGGGKGIEGVTNAPAIGLKIFVLTNGQVNLKDVKQFGVKPIDHGILTTKANAFGLPDRQGTALARAHAGLVDGVKKTAEANFAGVQGGPSIGAPSGDSGPSVGMGGGGGSGISAPVIAALSGMGGSLGISGGEDVHHIAAPSPASSGGGRGVSSAAMSA